MPDPTISVIIDAYTRGLQDGMKQAENSVKNASKSMTAAMADINQAAQLMQRTFTDVAGIVREVYALGKEGAQLQDVARRFYRLAGGAEEAERILVRLRVATKDTATDAELMDSALRMMSSGLADTTEELETIMRTVPALGKQMKGFGADRSLLSYTFMISNGLQSVRMRADDFGISVTTVESRMKQLEATGMDTRDALQQAVNEELIRVYDDLGLSAKTAADEMSANEASLKNMADTLKKDLVPLSKQMSEGFVALGNVVNPILQWLVEALGHVMAGLSGLTVGLGKATEAGIAFYNAHRAALRGDFEGAIQNLNLAFEKTGEITEAVKEETISYFNTWKANTQVTTDEVIESIGGVGEATDDLTERQKEFAEKTKEAMDAVAEAWDRAMVRQTRWAADNALRELRRIEDQEINTARRLEDMSRQLSASVAQAEAQAAKARAAAAREHAQRRIEIERDYRRRLREIQENYEVSAADAIARRDALALVRAQRQRDRELQDAERQRNEQMDKARESYAEQLRAIRESLAEQIAAAQEAHRQQEEELQRSLRRQEEDARRSQQRRIQDQAIALRREIQDIAASTIAKIQAYRAQYNVIESEYMAHLLRMQAMSRMAGRIADMAGGFQSGTSYVPRTGKYLLHKGEAVVPASQNIANRPVDMGGGGRGLAGMSSIRVDQTGWQFQGSFTEGDKQWFRQAARQETINAVMEITGE